MINSFSTKQIVIGIVCLVALIGLGSYVMLTVLSGDNELTEKGVTKDTKPPQTREAWMAGAKTGNEFFDPTKKNASTSTSGKLATKLDAVCVFDSQQMKVTCEAHRTSMQSRLNWLENHTDTRSSGEEEGVFEFIITAPSDSKIVVSLEECVSTACQKSETRVDISKHSQ